MKHPKLTVEQRSILGKKIKKLRREGILPGNVYGKDITSIAVQVSYKDFEPVFKQVHTTGLVDLELDGKKYPVLIHNVQGHTVNHTPLHVDFFKVNLKEKITTMVPIVTVGEAKAEVDKVGLVIHPLNEIEVEALPDKLPEHIEVNVEPLAELEQQITVGDLQAPEGVTILTDPGQVIVKVAELVTEEAQEQAEEEAAAAEAASEQGPAQPEGEETKEQPTEEEKKE